MDARPAAVPRPPAEIDVLEVHEHRLVEAAERQEPIAADEHGGAVRAHRRDDVLRRCTQIEAEARQRLAEEGPAPSGSPDRGQGATVQAELLRVGGETGRVVLELPDEQLDTRVSSTTSLLERRTSSPTAAREPSL